GLELEVIGFRQLPKQIALHIRVIDLTRLQRLQHQRWILENFIDQEWYFWRSSPIRRISFVTLELVRLPLDQDVRPTADVRIFVKRIAVKIAEIFLVLV